MEQVKTAAIVLAAGHGKRMHSKVAKQYLLLKGEPVVVHALRAFEKAEMDEIILVAGADEVEFCKKEYRGAVWIYQSETGRCGRKRTV